MMKTASKGGYGHPQNGGNRPGYVNSQNDGSSPCDAGVHPLAITLAT